VEKKEMAIDQRVVKSKSRSTKAIEEAQDYECFNFGHLEMP
jgi:hypothetical protein